MDRLEKIGTALVFVGLIAVLLMNTRSRFLHIPGADLNTSAAPNLTGPAYLTSALPIRRRNDDYADPASYYTASGEPYNPTWKGV